MAVEMINEAIKVPDLGGASQVEVIEICVSIGEQISDGQSIVVVESDKASMDIPSPLPGTVKSIAVVEGASVGEGDLLLELELAATAMTDEKSGNINTVDENIFAKKPDDVAEKLVGGKALGNNAELSSVGNEVTVTVPDLGGAGSVEVIEILVSVGGSVQDGDGLVTVESDKASMDIPSNVYGEVIELLVSVGSSISTGDALCRVKSVASAEPSDVVNANNVTENSIATQSLNAGKKDTVAEKIIELKLSSPVIAIASKTGDGGFYAGPSVRKLARELGIDLAKVHATGPKGRIAKDDLHSYVKQLAKTADVGASTGITVMPVPDIDFSQFGEIDIQPMTKMHKLTAANMHRSWLNVPHVTQYDDADITELEQFRQGLKPQMEKRGVKISPLAFIVKTVATALRIHPAFNSSLSADGQSIVYKQYVNVGMAVDTAAGLLVPVIRDADKKGIWELAEEITHLADLAKTRKLKPADMQGGCFTVSSLGSIGGKGFTPIINTPEVGILGVSKLSTQPVYVNGEFVPRQLLPLALSYDHRAVNGGDAGRFLTDIAAMLSDIRRQLL